MNKIIINETGKVTETPFHDMTPHIDIYYSTALSFFIKEAGRICEEYASDIYHNWNMIRNAAEDMVMECEKRMTALIGFRKSGSNCYIDPPEGRVDDFMNDGSFLTKYELTMTNDGETVTLTVAEIKKEG